MVELAGEDLAIKGAILSSVVSIHFPSISFNTIYSVYVCTTNFVMESVLTSSKGNKNVSRRIRLVYLLEYLGDFVLHL